MSRAAEHEAAPAGRWVADDVPATPAMVIDLPTVERNLRRMADYTAAHCIGLRPHTKTHKSRRIARMQLDAGAVGLTAAKVGEAEIMSELCDDVLLAYPAVDPARCGRLARLAVGRTVRVAVDTLAAAESLSAAGREAQSRIGILVDLDVGYHRTGVQSPQAALKLAQQVARQPNLRLDGLFFYPGHVTAPPDAQALQLEAIGALLQETLDHFARSGLAALIVSGGSTPTAYQSHRVPQQTEIRPGTYVYNDMNTASRGFCELDDCAARLVCTVVSDAVPGKVVLDAGSKTLTSDRNAADGGAGFGHVVEFPLARIIRLSEEHGEVDVSACQERPRVGQRIHVIPNHICPCVNLQDTAWLRERDGRLSPLAIDARGKLS